MDTEKIKKALDEVVHPAKDKSIIALGMVENIEAQTGKVTVTLAFSKHRDPLGEYLINATRAAVIRACGKGTEVEIKTIIKEEAMAFLNLAGKIAGEA